MWFLYLLYSEKIDRFYIGISQNPETRLRYHNTIENGWTSRGKPWKLVFMKGFPNRQNAQFWENKIKGQKSRAIIQKIINDEFIFE